MPPLESGKYRPNDTVTVTVWNEGEDPPAGFDLQRTSDGSRNAVKMERGEPVRDAEGNAHALPEGGALVEYGDGRAETLSAEQFEEFSRRYLPANDAGQATTRTVNGPTGLAQTAADPADTPAPDPADPHAQAEANAANAGPAGGQE